MSLQHERALKLPHDEGRARRNWEAIEARRRPARVRPRALPWVLAGIALAAVVLLTMVHPAPGPLALSDGDLAEGDHGVELRGPLVGFDDGSHVELDGDARVELLENTGSQVRLWLHRGRTRFDIVPGGPRRWVIESGEVTVEVLGTAFVVERDPHRIRVEVERGSVLVRGVEVPEGMRRLGADESIEVALHVPRDEREARDEDAEVLEPLGESVAATDEAETEGALEAIALAATEEASTGDAISPETARHSERVTHSDIAVRSDDTDPSDEGVPAGADEEEETLAEDPLVTADRLRAAGRIDEALDVLASVIDGAGARRDRAIAAFTMGRVLLDRQHRYPAAASAFERAIELGLAEPLLEDARARLTEARFLAGDPPGARAAAERYLAHHPSGRWRARVEEWAAE
jgi:transmembrane sensor